MTILYHYQQCDPTVSANGISSLRPTRLENTISILLRRCNIQPKDCLLDCSDTPTFVVVVVSLCVSPRDQHNAQPLEPLHDILNGVSDSGKPIMVIAHKNPGTSTTLVARRRDVAVLRFLLGQTRLLLLAPGNLKRPRNDFEPPWITKVPERIAHNAM
jgi:hypothetical protein